MLLLATGISFCALAKVHSYDSGDEPDKIGSRELRNMSDIFNFRLFPNMDKKEAVISYYIDKTRNVYFTLTNSLGHVLAEKCFNEQTKGSYFLPIDITLLNSGDYFFQLEIDKYKMRKKLVVD